MPKKENNMAERNINISESNIANDVPAIPRHVSYREVPLGDEVAAWGPRRLLDFELILVLRGSFRFENYETGEVFEQRANEVLAIYPEELTSFRKTSSGPAFFSCIHLEPPEGWPRPPRRGAFPPEHAVHELFSQVARHHDQPGRYQAAITGHLLAALWLAVCDPPGAGPDDRRLRAMLDYLETHLTAHPTRRQLAAQFFLTPQRINAIFKEKLALSPGEYVHRELARRAYAMLLDEGLSVKETAQRLGFADPFHFTRVFKKHYHFAPGTVHRQAKNRPR